MVWLLGSDCLLFLLLTEMEESAFFRHAFFLIESSSMSFGFYGNMNVNCPWYIEKKIAMSFWHPGGFSNWILKNILKKIIYIKIIGVWSYPNRKDNIIKGNYNFYKKGLKIAM